METITLETIIQWVGPGPVAAILFVLWKFKPIYEQHVKSLQRDNTLKKVDIQLKLANFKFLQDNGYDIKIPDISQEL